MRAAGAVREQTPFTTENNTAAEAHKINLDELIQTKSSDASDAIEKEVAKGYSIAFSGIAQPVSGTSQSFDGQLQRLIDGFDGPVAITLNGSRFDIGSPKALSILVPTGGTSHARLATEIALALAKATRGQLTVLHVFDPQEDTNLLRGRARRLGMSVLVDARRLGKRSGVHVDALTSTNTRPEIAIRRAASASRYDLVVLGASLRMGDKKFLGPRSAALVRAVKAPILLIAQ
jgi:nucleotide-binding universal stress UspA family protein